MFFRAIKNVLSLNIREFSVQPRLIPIGVLSNADHTKPFEAGQLFIHKLFGYRGIIIKMWEGNLYDRKSTTSLRYINYYQSLIDSRDLSRIKNLSSRITFLPTDKNTIYVITDMDYVTHDDILPYTTSDTQPLINDYFSRFFMSCPDQEPNFLPTELLTQWIESKKQCLEVTDVYQDVVEDIRITSMPFYMGSFIDSDADDATRCWRYIIRIEYLGDSYIILRKRDFKVLSSSGQQESLQGKGVQPVLSKEKPVFQYHSHVQLKCSSGHVWGYYTFERSSRHFISVKIPSIRLTSNLPVNPSKSP